MRMAVSIASAQIASGFSLTRLSHPPGYHTPLAALPVFGGRLVGCSALTFWGTRPTPDVPFGVARRRSPGRRSALTIWARALPSVHGSRTGARLRSGTVRSYQSRESLTVAISASEARSRLFPLIQQVNDDHLPVRISSKGGDAVLMSAADFDSWQETIYLLRSPANARRLMEAVERDKFGRGAVVKTLEELQDLAGE